MAIESYEDGFETPYGMELLSSVHWVVHHDGNFPTDVGKEPFAVHGWNDRKRKMFKPDHIEVAWSRLKEEGWL